jgi:hypothetical protein
MVEESGIVASFAHTARSPASPYYSPEMQPARPRTPRRRPRRGSVERPLDTRLVRGASVVVLAAILLAAFTIARPGSLPPPDLPPAFDGATAASLAAELAARHPDRTPGSPGSLGAARWLTDKLALYGLGVQEDVWRQDVPGLGRVELRNLIAVVPGRTSGAIVVVAHRDNSGRGRGASDNATGTAALVELARPYAAAGTLLERAQPQHTLVFLSTDGGAFGALGAARFARSRLARDALAALTLDGLAGPDRPRLELAGDGSRSPDPALVQTLAARVADEGAGEAARPGLLRQLVDLGVPFAYGEQGPLLGSRIPAVRLTGADDGGRSEAADDPERLDVAQLTRLGRAAEAALGSLDLGAEVVQGSAPSLFLGGRVVRGWALQLVLVAALLPFFAGLLDLVVRCRRLGVAFAPGARALLRHLAVWLAAGLAIVLAAVTGLLPDGPAAPLPPRSQAVSDIPALGLALTVAAAGAVWLLLRRRAGTARPVTAEDELGGYAVALAGLGSITVATALANPFALVFVLPSAYAWLLLPSARGGRGWARDLLYGAGLAGPAVALVSLAHRFALGAGVVPYVLGLAGVGYIPLVTLVLVLCWCAVATQVGAVAAGCYRCDRAERPAVLAPATSPVQARRR